MIKDFLKRILNLMNLGVTTAHELQLLRDIKQENIEMLSYPADRIKKILDLSSTSHGQLKQDIFVLSQLDYKKGGFFVEFGATNGLDISNTYLLEKEYNWNGILAEPAKHWHVDLKKNRNCKIETDCVWTKTGSTLVFNETEDKEFSTLNQFSNLDGHKNKRANGNRYNVNTISLNDLLAKHDAPTSIDYLSIDTEGSEYEILSHFNFELYTIKIITCEHNSTKDRKKIYKLLTQKGYKRKYVGFSRWDDWYVKMDK